MAITVLPGSRSEAPPTATAALPGSRSESGTSTAGPVRFKSAKAKQKVDWKRIGFILLGMALFALIYCSPAWDPAVDPKGQAFPLTREGKAALALFFLAATWWVTEVIPIGVTSIAIGVVQALFLIRPAHDAFTDFMDPSVWFIFGSLMIGMVFTKTGLTRRMAYKMLSVVGGTDEHDLSWLLCHDGIAHTNHGPHGCGSNGLSIVPSHLRLVL